VSLAWQLQDGLGNAHSYAGPWFDPAATGWMALSRWTRPTGRRGNRRNRQRCGGKALIIVAAEEDGKASDAFVCVRYRMRQREPARFIREAIAPGSTVRTDGWKAYLGLQGYVHDRQVQSHQEEGEHLLPRVHRVIALLKRWLLGTHQGAIGPQHLDDYLDEFTFRFNRRKSKSRGKLFYRLAQQAVQVGPVPLQP